MQVHVTYLARCEMSKDGYRQMDSLRWSLNKLYNAALAQRSYAYKTRKQRITYYDQTKWLPRMRKSGRFNLDGVSSSVARGMLTRLDEAYKSFFRRVKAGQNPGHPRFRPYSRCRTVEFSSVAPGIVKPDAPGRYALRSKGLPPIRLRPTCELPSSADLKSLKLTLRGMHWEASLTYKVDKDALPTSDSAVGVDLGVRKRATCSNGKRYKGHRRDWKRMRRLQRAVSRSRKGSKTRRKRVQKLACYRRREQVSQRNECHRISSDLVQEHGLIAVEKLNVKNMTKSAKGSVEEPGRNVRQKAGLNREALSQNWSLLRQQLKYKAEWAGREYVEVNPAYTSQDCSRCGARNNPKASEVYRCKSCGLIADRDVNAAINILRLAGGTVGDDSRRSGNAVHRGTRGSRINHRLRERSSEAANLSELPRGPLAYPSVTVADAVTSEATCRNG